MKGQHITAVGIAVASVFVVSAALASQDRSNLKSPNGIAFSEFRGYDAWQVITPSQPDGGVKSIQGNPVMIKAYQDGFPANGKTVPDGAMMAKIEWSTKINPLMPGFAKVPDTLKKLSFMVKDSKRFLDTDGWGYAEFAYDATSGAFKPYGDSPAFAKTACHQCHVAGAKARDFVFADYAKR